jgi:hypothetical protein
MCMVRSNYIWTEWGRRGCCWVRTRRRGGRDWHAFGQLVKGGFLFSIRRTSRCSKHLSRNEWRQYLDKGSIFLSSERNMDFWNIIAPVSCCTNQVVFTFFYVYKRSQRLPLLPFSLGDHTTCIELFDRGPTCVVRYRFLSVLSTLFSSRQARLYLQILQGQS